MVLTNGQHYNEVSTTKARAKCKLPRASVAIQNACPGTEEEDTEDSKLGGNIYFLISEYTVGSIKESDSAQSLDDSTIRHHPATMTERPDLSNKREQDLHGIKRHFADVKCLAISEYENERIKRTVLNLTDSKGSCESTLNYSHLEDLFKSRADGTETSTLPAGESYVLSTCHEEETESSQSCSGFLPMKSDISCNSEEKLVSSLSEQNQESNESIASRVETQESMKGYCNESFNKPTVCPDTKEDNIFTLIVPPQNISALEINYITHCTNHENAEHNREMDEHQKDKHGVASLNDKVIPKTDDDISNASLSFSEVNCFTQVDPYNILEESLYTFENPQNMSDEDVQNEMFPYATNSSNNREVCYGDITPCCEVKHFSATNSQAIFDKVEQEAEDSLIMDHSKHEFKTMCVKDTCDQIRQYVERDQQVKSIGFDEVQENTCIKSAKNESLKELVIHSKLNTEQGNLCNMTEESSHGFIAPENTSDGQEDLKKMLVLHDKSNGGERKNKSDPSHRDSHNKYNSDTMPQSLINQLEPQDKGKAEKNADRNVLRMQFSEENHGQCNERSGDQQVEKLEIMNTGEFQEDNYSTGCKNESVNEVLKSCTQDTSTISSRKEDLCLVPMEPFYILPTSERSSIDQIVVEKSFVLDSHESDYKKEYPNTGPTCEASCATFFLTSNSHRVLEAGFHGGESDESSSNDDDLRNSAKEGDSGHTSTHRNRENENWAMPALLNTLNEASESNGHKNLTICNRLVAEQEMKAKKDIDGKSDRIMEADKANEIVVENILSSQAGKTEGSRLCVTIETEANTHSVYALAKNSVEHLDCNPTETVITSEPVHIYEAIEEKDLTDNYLISHAFITIHEVPSHQNSPIAFEDQGIASGKSDDASNNLLAGEGNAKLVKDSITNFIAQISPNNFFIQHGEGVNLHSCSPELTRNENSYSKSKLSPRDQVSSVHVISEGGHQNSTNSFQSPGNEMNLSVASGDIICSSQQLSDNTCNDCSTIPAAHNHSLLNQRQNLVKETETEPSANIQKTNLITPNKKRVSAEAGMVADNSLIGCKYIGKNTHGENSAFDVDCGTKITHLDAPIPEQPSLLRPSESQSTCNESKEKIIIAEVLKGLSEGPLACHPDEPESIATDGLCQCFTKHESSPVKSSGNSTVIQAKKEEMKGNVHCSCISPPQIKYVESEQAITQPARHNEKGTKNVVGRKSSQTKTIQQPSPAQMEKTMKKTFNYKLKGRPDEFPGKKENKTAQDLATAYGSNKQLEKIFDTEEFVHRTCIPGNSGCYRGIKNGSASEGSGPNLARSPRRSNVSFQTCSLQNASAAAPCKTVESTRKGKNLKLYATQEKNAPLTTDKLPLPSHGPKYITRYQEKLLGRKNKDSVLFKSVNNILASRNGNKKDQKLTCSKVPAISSNAGGPEMVKNTQRASNNVQFTSETEKNICKLRPQKCKVEKNESLNINLKDAEEKKPDVAVEIQPNKKDIKGQEKEKDSSENNQKAPQLLKEIQAEILPDCSGDMKLFCHFTDIHGDSTVTWTKDSKLLIQTRRSAQDDSPVSLKIVQTNKKDQGLYRCCLKNSYGKVTAEFNLTTEVLDSLSSYLNLEGGEEIEFNQLLFREDFICDKYFAGNVHGRIVTEELHFGEGANRKAFRSKVIYGLVPMFHPGHLCVLKVHNAIAYGNKTNDEVVQKNYKLAVQECYVQNTAREYAKIYATEAEPLEEFGDVPEIIPIFLIRRPANNIPYATVEEELIGEFVKYSIRDGKEINFRRRDSEAGQKCCTFQHWVYEKTNGNLLVTDMQGVGMKLTDVGIATLAKGYKGFKGNCPVSFIDQFKVLHQCNRYCKMLSLKPLQSSLHQQRKLIPVEKNTPPNSSKLPKTVLGTQNKRKT
uniref:non-specific serine/threonine protein kinase n=1 Tax=Geotrypetes seraphini TaxID=260995 RepID=A0A6P8SC36_GEOSA|nr:alpha-protein kinase 2 [Geotrypetes seraphini]